MELNRTIIILGLSALTTIAAIAPSTAAPTQTTAKTEMANSQSMAKMIATTGQFSGIEVKKGTVNLSQMGKNFKLSVSSDFTIPGSPAPHWQVVDKEGNTFLLNQFRIAGDKMNREITLPSYIHSIAKVQVWCSFAEVVLGEAKFTKAITLK